MPFSAPGRRSGVFDLAGGKASNDTFLRTFGTSGTVFSIVTILATSVSAPDWHLYKKQPQDGRRRYTTGDQGSDQRTEVVQHPALTLWQQPNDFHTRFEFTEAFQQHLELCGEAWWVLGRASGTSFPTTMWCVRPDRMDVIPSPDGYLQGYVYTGPSGEQIPLDLDEVIFLKYPNPLDPYRGAGPVASILPNIQQQKYATEYQRNLFLNGADPGAIIQLDRRLTDREWDEFTSRWRESHQGVARAGRIGILENGAQWQAAAGASNKDLEYGNLRLANRDELREAWGIHKAMLGNADDVNRANAESAEEVFESWKVIPRLNRIKMALNNKLLPLFGASGQGVEFDYENPLPDDREADNSELTVKANAASVLVDAGFDPGDVLEAVGLPDMAVAEKATQMPALPPGWVPPQPGNAPPGAPQVPAAGAAGGGSEGEGATSQARESTRLLRDSAAARAFRQESRDYPASAMAWMHHATWTGPVKVPQSHVDPDFSALDPADPHHVDDFIQEIREGKKLDPVILVKRPSKPLLQLADGHHRYLAAVAEGKKIRAFIAVVDSDNGPWETMHKQQIDKPRNELDLELFQMLHEYIVKWPREA